MKKILCLDFDGVCHSYVSGWQGIDNIPDPPVSGLKDFIDSASEYFDVQIFSSRSMNEAGREAMMDWFMYWFGEDIFDIISFPDHKPPAYLSIDDRALTFTGIWPKLEELTSFEPWVKGSDDLTNYQDLINGRSNTG